ncbi:MAG: hypothetical protein H7235_10370 [Bdellovibrionaceae bacterium]|nr:hypothetical protein [Pseudobdellovibrionaceae bacterium]
MKLFMILTFVIVGLNLLAKPGEKIERKLASIKMNSESVTSALSRNGLVNNSQTMVNELTKTTSYKCADTIQSSELKDIDVVNSKNISKSFKFKAVRMCFDQLGPGVVEVRYDGLIRNVAGDLEVSEVKIKLVQNSND